MCNHGTKRNYRMGADLETFEGVDGSGEPFSFTYAAHEYSVNDMFCVECGDWVEAKGVMGAILCPRCNTPWDKCPACDGTGVIPEPSGCGEASGGWGNYCTSEYPLPVEGVA